MKSLLKLFNSYPLWARIGIFAGLMVSLTITVFAPRESMVVDIDDIINGGQGVYMRIREIQLFPPKPDAEIQLYIFVNGTEYRHPSVGGVEWMKVGSNMSHKVIPIPDAMRYEIRFELKHRNGLTIEGKPTILGSQEPIDMTSQHILQVVELPHEEVYNLYAVKNATRAASVGATVSYKVYRQ